MFADVTFLAAEPHAPVIEPAGAEGVFSLLWLIIALPALGAAVLLLGGRRTDAWGHLLGVATVSASFVLGLVSFFTLMGRGAEDRSVDQFLYTWFEAGAFRVDMALLFDPLNIRFATDSTNMQLWNAHNPFRACFVGADGHMVLFDFKGGPDKMLSDFNLLRKISID